MRSERCAPLAVPVPVAIAVVVVAEIAVSSCEVRVTVMHPKFANGGELAATTPLPPGRLALLEGMYAANPPNGAGRFGVEVALHAARDVDGDTLSVFAADHAAYAILHAGCADGGSRVVLEGYWRYAGDTVTGLVRLGVGPSSLARALCAPGDPGANAAIPVERTLTGATGLGVDDPDEGLTLAFDHALKRPRTPFIIVAHHGACRTIDDCGASENSLETIRMAESFGASVVEIDVRVTADGVPILFHDDAFGDRLTTGAYCHGPVSDFTLAHVRALCKLKYGEDVPTLEDALRVASDETKLVGLWLDTKVPEAVAPTVAVMGKSPTPKDGRYFRHVIGLGERDVYDAYRALPPAPDVRCLVELDPSDVRAAPCQVWGPRWTRGPQTADVEALHRDGFAVVYWTIDSIDYIDLFMRSAPNGMLSDRPGLVFHRFQTVGIPPPPRGPL